MIEGLSRFYIDCESYLHVCVCVCVCVCDCVCVCVCVCVEVLQPSQPTVVMSSAVDRERSGQLPFLNHRKGDNKRRKYFTINPNERKRRPGGGPTRNFLIIQTFLIIYIV